MNGRASLAGFVLAGGKSSRMGENKAFLPYSGRTLIERIAEAVSDAAGRATVIGDAGVYRHLGFPVIPDRLSNCGPLAGIEAALAHTDADWNLIVACDMPALNRGLLQALCGLTVEMQNEPNCVVPQSRDGRLQPLCAIYHRECLESAQAALARGDRKVVDWVATLHVRYWPVENASGFQNVNTPREWRDFLESS